jgi:hypothetical protein
MRGQGGRQGKDGKPVTLETIRGTVTAVGSASLTVKAEDGFTETFAATQHQGQGGADKLGDVKVGAKGAVVGVKSGTTVTAARSWCGSKKATVSGRTGPFHARAQPRRRRSASSSSRACRSAGAHRSW